MGKVAHESTRGAAGRNDEASSLWSRTIDRPGGRLYASVVRWPVDSRWQSRLQLPCGGAGGGKRARVEI